MRSIKPNKLNAIVQEQIKLYIIEKGLKAGDMLPTEKVLEEQLGISRTSIREALKSLEALGIIEVKHGVGRYLRDFNYEAILANLSYNIEVNVRHFREIIDVRIALETHFFESVVEKFSREDIGELYRMLEEMESLVRTGADEERLIEAHTEFHLKLYEPTGNVLLSHLIRLFESVQRMLAYLHRYRTSDKQEFIEMHRNIIEAIENGDTARGKQELLAHFKDIIAWHDESETQHRAADSRDGERQ